MYAAITIDQKASTGAADRVPAMVQLLDDLTANYRSLPFERTVGDELQGIVEDPLAVALVVRAVADEPGDWWIGIGIGDVDYLDSASVRASSGPALVAARAAVEAAKRGRSGGEDPRPWPLRVRLANGPSRLAESSLALLHFVVTERSPAARETINLLRQGTTQASVAAKLGVSQPTVSKALRTGHWAEERAAQDIAMSILETVMHDA